MRICGETARGFKDTKTGEVYLELFVSPKSSISDWTPPLFLHARGLELM